MNLITVNYRELYSRAQILPNKIHEALDRVELIEFAQHKYQDVSDQTKVPWWCIAAVHSLECGLNFNCHIHNGDPLAVRTVHKPAGRPAAPPANGISYSWQESAIDALKFAWKPQNWSFQGCLFFLEAYNGLSYRSRGINSPYLWAATTLYDKGLFVEDGKFDPNAVSEQIGAAALLKIMQQKGFVPNF